jgi:copper(I)-binding protein
MTESYRCGAYRVAGLIAAMLLSASVYAGDIQVEGAWSRATAPGQDTAMVDLKITSQQAASLVGVSSPAAGSVELHSMTHDNGMMKMREVQAIALPAGKCVDMGESGYHLMLIGLKAQLKAGDSVPLTLSIKVADKAVVKVEARAEVKPLTETAPTSDEHMHHHHHSM